MQSPSLDLTGNQPVEDNSASECEEKHNGMARLST